MKTIERHSASSQTFVPLDGGRYLVVVMRQESDRGPDPAHAKAFVATERQAINYDVGTWHVGMTVLDRPTSFWMTIFEDGGPTIAVSASWSDRSSSRRPKACPALRAVGWRP